MMRVKFMRTDDRLIHGQVMVRWVSHLKVKKIVIFDDDIANDEMMADIFKLACPKGVELIISKISDSESVKEKIVGKEDNTIILTRSPKTMEKVMDAGFSPEIGYNIGPISNKPNTKKMASFCYLLDDEVQALKNIHQKGVYIFIQTVPDAEKLEWDDIEKLM